jgi:hypothetical protein
MKSLESRLAALRQAVGKRLPPHVHYIKLNVVATREAALAALERSARPEKPCAACLAGSKPKVVVLTSGELFKLSQSQTRKESSNE